MTDQEKTEIKKKLYKLKPTARYEGFRHGHLYYMAEVEGKEVRFEVPAVDTGDAFYAAEMEAQLLIRYLYA